MGSWPQDILDRIRSNFPNDTELVESTLDDLKSARVPEHIRVARCALHLAKGDLEEFGNMHEAACRDYRDVIWWAEYDHPDNPDVQIHDFNQAFCQEDKFRMSKPEFTADEQFLICHVQSSTALQSSASFMWGYVVGSILLAGCGAYYKSVGVMIAAFIVLVGFRIYEEHHQKRWVPLWCSVIQK